MAHLVELLLILARARHGEVYGAVQQDAREQGLDRQQLRKYALSAHLVTLLMNTRSWMRPHL